MFEWLKKIIGIKDKVQKPAIDDTWPKILPDYVVKKIPENRKEPASEKLQRQGIEFKENKQLKSTESKLGKEKSTGEKNDRKRK
jgi:hypothetical protein